MCHASVKTPIKPEYQNIPDAFNDDYINEFPILGEWMFGTEDLTILAYVVEINDIEYYFFTSIKAEEIYHKEYN